MGDLEIDQFGESRKIRLDQALVERGLVRSRSLAQKMIESKQVYIQKNEDSQPELAAKPSMLVSQVLSQSIFPKILIQEGAANRFVSRGGLKLEAALQQFQFNPTGLRVLDLGLSTGGFTDCLLQKGAKEVVGIDVGHGQTAPEIANDPRVQIYEGVNARDLSQIYSLTPVDLIVMDVSFISITKVVEESIKLLKSQGFILALVKPQFELDRLSLNDQGIVTDTALFEKVKQKIHQYFLELHLKTLGYVACPVKGSDGNQEFFIYAQKN